MDWRRLASWLWKTAKNAYKTVDAKLRTHPVRQCPHCGKDVVSFSYQVKIYCNNICYQRCRRAKTKKIRQQRVCLECDKLFTPTRDRHYRCSDHCRKIFQIRYAQNIRLKYQNKKERHPCKFCGQLFVPSHYLVIFCSPPCKRAHEATIKVKPKLLIQPNYRDITVDDLNTSNHAKEIAEFKEAGGQVQTYPTIPNPPVPNARVRMKVLELDTEEWAVNVKMADLDMYEDFLKNN